jgi:hypothetical protein
MPINEAAGIRRRSHLTKEQKRQAEASIYGLQDSLTPMPNEQFSTEDIDRMRAILAQHDAQNRGGIKEFDLNKPPKEPYTFQEFPKLVYDHTARKHQTVRNAHEEKAALTAGWRNEPYPAELPEPAELDAEDAAEAARLDKIARKKKQAA